MCQENVQRVIKLSLQKDHAAVQLDIAEVDEQTGRATGKNRTYALCGSIRMMGEADDSLVSIGWNRWILLDEDIILEIPK